MSRESPGVLLANFRNFVQQHNGKPPAHSVRFALALLRLNGCVLARARLGFSRNARINPYIEAIFIKTGV